MKHVFSYMCGAQTLWLFCRGDGCHQSHSFCLQCFVNKVLVWLLSGENELDNQRGVAGARHGAHFLHWPNYLPVTILEGAGNTLFLLLSNAVLNELLSCFALVILKLIKYAEK